MSSQEMEISKFPRKERKEILLSLNAWNLIYEFNDIANLYT